jgi:hypothetical protein
MNVMTEKQMNDCRIFARQVWREEPSVSAEDMIKRTEIIDVACNGIKFTTSQLYYAIRPLDASTDELPLLKNLKMWRLDIAVSIWQDLNPFIISQAKNSGKTQFWNTAFHPSLRSAFFEMYVTAESDAQAGLLKAHQGLHGEFLVNPQDFYVWAMSAVGEPNGDRPINFFEELKITWAIQTKPGAILDETVTRDIKQQENDKVNNERVNSASNGHLAAFLAMKDLTGEELSITFVGDLTETGLSANSMLEISARDVTKRIPMAALDLVNKHTGDINTQGATLLAMTKNKRLSKTDANIKKISRLRSLFTLHLGINHDPFHSFRTGYGWEPRFNIHDRRGAADNRAKHEAERRTISYDDLKNNAVTPDEENEMGTSFKSEVNSAEDWLKSEGFSWNNDVDPELF